MSFSNSNLNDDDSNSLKRLRVFLAIFLVFICSLLLIAAFYSMPSADDFCYGKKANDLGIIGASKDFYINWSGRYSATYFISLFSFKEYVLTYFTALSSITILLASLFSTLLLAQFLFGLRNNLILALAIFLLFVTSYSLKEGIYWIAGAQTYGLSFAIFIAMLAYEFRIFVESVNFKKYVYFLLPILGLLLVGFNETIMVVHVAFISLLLIYLAFKEKKSNALLLTIMFFSLVGAGFVIGAPGNAIRAAHFPERNVVLAVTKSLLPFAKLIGFYYIPSLLALSALFFVLKPKINETINGKKLHSFLWRC